MRDTSQSYDQYPQKWDAGDRSEYINWHCHPTESVIWTDESHPASDGWLITKANNPEGTCMLVQHGAYIEEVSPDQDHYPRGLPESHYNWFDAWTDDFWGN